MFGLACLALALPLTAAHPQSRPEEQTAPFKADLRVDTNRDGTVDLSGKTDSIGKDTWSESYGALFLPNIGQTRPDCRDDYTCHDASTNAQWAPEYMAPMRTVPMPNISGSATAIIAISDPVARRNVRIFLDYPGRTEINPGDLIDGSSPPPAENTRWVYLENDTPIPADKLRQGLTLGIDARDTRHPGRLGWDGRVSVEFKVTDGSRSSSDKAMLRVAPVLTHHHLQTVEKVFVTKKPVDEEMTKAMARLEQSIQKNMQKAGIKEPLHRLDIDYTWAQDVLEPAYASIPGPLGPITLRIDLAGRPVMVGRDDLVEKLLFQDLRREGVGAVRPGGFPAILNHKDLEAGGNVESIPPYTFNGKKYPAGRIVIGATDAKTPQALAYLRAQETQDPIALDTTWLAVKHVDEILGFLPAKTSRGWRLAILDPMMGYEALSKLDQDGHGDVPLTSKPMAQNSTVPTVREFLADVSTKKAATHSADKMKQALDTLQQETGIADEDVVRIPAVIATMDSLKKWLHARDYEGPSSGGNRFLPLNSAFPSQINGVPLSDSVFIAPKPWGPVVDGEDMIEKMSREAYAAAGFDVDFIDDWELHLGSGDLHCYTNTYRTPTAQWW
ncbi:arginine deiminase type-3, partial [Metarhizium majus ARSEF 297]